MSVARVCWVIKGLGRGGAERLLTLTAPRIDRSRFDVEIVYMLSGADAFVAELEGAGLPVRCLDATGTLAAGWPRRLRGLLRKTRYDIIHTHSPVPAVATRLLAPRSARLVHTEHNVWDVYRWPTRLANALTYPRNDAVLAVSDRVAASTVRPKPAIGGRAVGDDTGGDGWADDGEGSGRRPRWAFTGPHPPVETLLHGVDTDGVPRGSAARAEARARIGVDPGALVLGTVANFSRKKDHQTLLRALVSVRERVPNVLLLLVGTGPLEQTLRAKVEQMGLGNCVRFLGSRGDVLELLPAFDLFVLSSLFEGLPISLLEAMTAEVACVVTEVGGIPEAVRDGREGRLVPASDPAALAAAVTQLLLDPARRQATAVAGRRRVVERFSIERAVIRTEELYDELLTRTNEARA